MSASRRVRSSVGGLLTLAEIASARLQGRHFDIAPRGDRTRRVLVLERVEGRPHHVVGVRRAERFRHHVLHAQRFEHRAHRPAGDDAGPGGGRPQVYASGPMAAGYVVVQRAAFSQGDADETAFGGVGRLANRLRHFARLAVAEADPPLFVADHDERGKAEAAATLNHLGDAVDVHELIGEFAFALFPVAAIAWFTCHDFVPTCYSLRPAPKSQPLYSTLTFPLRPCLRVQKSSPPSRAASASALTRPW